MNVVGLKDDREFAIRRNIHQVYYVEGKNLSSEWKQNNQFSVKPSPNTTKISILMHYVYEDKSAKQMEKTGFIVVTSDEGFHKEPSYQQDLDGYGTILPYQIDVKKRMDGKELYYILMPYAKGPDVKGYYDMILYADSDLEIRELIDWKHTLSIQGEWTPEISGGDKSGETWLNNPQYLLTLPQDLPEPHVTITILLAQAKAALDLIPYQVMPYQFYIGYYVLEAGHVETIVTQCETWKNAQETYIHFTVNTTKGNKFVIIPTTHSPGQLTSFTLIVFSDVLVELVKR